MQTEALRFLAAFVNQSFPPVKVGLAYGSGVVPQDSQLLSQQPTDDDSNDTVKSGAIIHTTPIDHTSVNSKGPQPQWRRPCTWPAIRGIFDRVDRRFSTRQIDMILVVDDLRHWHFRNLAQNPRHYSFTARQLGATLLTRIQHAASGMWYNPFVRIDWLQQYAQWKGVQLSKDGNVSETTDNKLMVDVKDADFLKDIFGVDFRSFSRSQKRRAADASKNECAAVELKYGVIDTETLLEDCMLWNKLYCAGRLHKPVHVFCANLSLNAFLFEQSDEYLDTLHKAVRRFADAKYEGIIDSDIANATCVSADKLQWAEHFTVADALFLNWDFALRVALILLLTQKQSNSRPVLHSAHCRHFDANDHGDDAFSHSGKLTVGQLLECIVAISYMGDFRVRMGADRYKVQAIANTQFTQLWNIYGSLLSRYVTVLKDPSTDSVSLRSELRVDCDSAQLMEHLPLTVRKRMAQEMAEGTPDCDACVHCALTAVLASIVSDSSNSANVTSLISAGFLKSLRYCTVKVYKALKQAVLCESKQ